MEGADGKAHFIRRYELKKMLGKDRITSTDILNLDPSKITRKPAGDDFYKDSILGKYNILGGGKTLDDMLGVNRTVPEYKDDTPVVYESSSDKSSSETPKFVTPKAGADLSGGSTKAAETTMKIAQQNKETKAEKAARQKRIDKNLADWKKKQNEMNITPTKKEEQTAKGQITGKGYTGGSGFTKGGLASKPKPKPKKKRTTKGLGTKPKAT